MLGDIYYECIRMSTGDLARYLRKQNWRRKEIKRKAIF